MLVNSYIEKEEKEALKAVKVEEAAWIEVCSLGVVGEALLPYNSMSEEQYLPSPQRSAQAGSQPWSGGQQLAKSTLSKGPLAVKEHIGQRERHWLPLPAAFPSQSTAGSISLPLRLRRREGKICQQGGLGDSSLFVTLDKCQSATSVKWRNIASGKYLFYIRN